MHVYNIYGMMQYPTDGAKSLPLIFIFLPLCVQAVSTGTQCTTAQGETAADGVPAMETGRRHL